MRSEVYVELPMVFNEGIEQDVQRRVTERKYWNTPHHDDISVLNDALRERCGCVAEKTLAYWARLLWTGFGRGGNSDVGGFLEVRSSLTWYDHFYVYQRDYEQHGNAPMVAMHSTVRPPRVMQPHGGTIRGWLFIGEMDPRWWCPDRARPRFEVPVATLRDIPSLLELIVERQREAAPGGPR